VTALSQVVQAPPPVPQVCIERVEQTPFTQQPLGQLVASQAQAPFTQRWVAAHEGPVPQRQPPLVQRSARSGSHAWQAAPWVPHEVADAGLQVAPEQQPLGQVVALQPEHTPPAQV
jgi:hypothetical protein